MATVKSLKYKTLDFVSKLRYFAIYETKKGTQIALYSEYKMYFGDTFPNVIDLYYHDSSKEEWRGTSEEGKKIQLGCLKIFDSNIDDIKNIDISKWNMSSQIIVYELLGL